MSENIVLNPGLEEGIDFPTGWDPGVNDPTLAQVLWDNTDFHSGAHSVKIIVTTGGFANFQQYIDKSLIVEGGRYRIGVWHKGTAQFYLGIHYIDVNGQRFNYARAPTIMPSTDWVFTSLEIDAPIGADWEKFAYFRLEALQTTPLLVGEVSLDDFEMVLITAPPPPTEWTLSVNSNPISGVPFTIDIGGVSTPFTTPWSEMLGEGSYVVAMSLSIQIGQDTYNFKQWEDGSTNPVRTVNLIADTTITATYELVAPVTYTLTISTGAGGTTNPAPGSYPIAQGQTQQVTALPDTNYRFANWLLDGIVKTENPITVTMDRDHTLVAVFKYVPPPPVYHTLIITATAGGTTNPTLGRYDYLEGETVIVTAIPDANYRFVNWELDATIKTENPITVTMDRDYSLRAVFEYVPPPPLTATIQGYIRDKAGTPIPGATVTCDGYADITEIDGAYAFIDIPAQAYTLTVTMTGYQPLSIRVDASTGGTYPINLELTPVTPPPCFVATVAFGSPLASELNVLRRFRDRCLPFKVTKAYYTVGPFLAQLIKRRNAIKRYVREVLNLIVKMVEWVK